jgi:hypothetical protein
MFLIELFPCHFEADVVADDRWSRVLTDIAELEIIIAKNLLALIPKPLPVFVLRRQRYAVIILKGVLAGVVFEAVIAFSRSQ